MTATIIRDAEAVALIREFVAMPSEALPGAAWTDTDMGGNPWQALRQVAKSGAVEDAPSTVRLHADRDGWRDGRIVSLPEMQPTTYQIVETSFGGDRRIIAESYSLIEIQAIYQPRSSYGETREIVTIDATAKSR